MTTAIEHQQTMRLPRARGPISADVLRYLREPAGNAEEPFGSLSRLDPGSLDDEDLQLSLFLCYGVHYYLFAEVDSRWEWNPALLAVRARLEERFAHDLGALVGETPSMAASDVPRFLLELGKPKAGASLVTYLRSTASQEQFKEFLIHRSLYSLMEADHHSWVIPRVRGAAKAALIEIQADEYGGGRPGRMHSDLFRLTMSELGLNYSVGAYADVIPATSIANVNLISYFGLHGRMRGALLGNLAITEIGSSYSNRGFGRGLRRVGGSSSAGIFFDEHVVADAVHEQLAAHDMCGGFVKDHPSEKDLLIFGAMATAAVASRANQHIVSAWERGTSSLRGTE